MQQKILYEQLDCWIITFRTIKSPFCFSSLPPYNRGGRWKPIHSNKAPKPVDASSRLGQELYRSHPWYQNLDQRHVPPIEKRKRLAATWFHSLSWHTRILFESGFFGSNNRWQEIYLIFHTFLPFSSIPAPFFPMPSIPRWVKLLSPGAFALPRGRRPWARPWRSIAARRWRRARSCWRWSPGDRRSYGATRRRPRRRWFGAGGWWGMVGL